MKREPVERYECKKSGPGEETLEGKENENERVENIFPEDFTSRRMQKEKKTGRGRERDRERKGEQEIRTRQQTRCGAPHFSTWPESWSWTESENCSVE